MDEVIHNELLSRLDERSANTYKMIEKIERHLAIMNGTIAKNCTDIASGRTDRKNIWWAISCCLVGLIGVFIVHFMGV